MQIEAVIGGGRPFVAGHPRLDTRRRRIQL
jgi:hypothetical protein